MNAIIYDIEIERAIVGNNESQLADIEYCGGWSDYENMGISVIAAYDYAQDRYRVFCRDNFDEFRSLIESTEWFIGFNNTSFDNSVCAANGILIPNHRSYDLVVEIWKSDGLEPKFNYSSHSGYSLNNCIKANFPQHSKTGLGADAPIQWQRNQIGGVIDYCLADVWLSRMLFERIVLTKQIISPKNGKKLFFEDQSWWADLTMRSVGCS